MIPPWNTKRRIRAGVSEFRFTVVTTVPDETFGLPLEITGNYDFNADWGDGSDSDITLWNHADTIHEYVIPGTYTISITGTIIGWTFNNLGDCALYYETKSWGPLRLGNSGGYFYGCENHTCTATDVLDLTGTLIFDSGFRNNFLVTEIPSINSLDWSSVISSDRTLANCVTYNQDISSLDMSSNADMQYMLYNTAFDQNLSAWDIGALTNATSFLENSTLSVANYDALILSWSAQAQTIVANFHGGNSKYTTGGAVLTARDAWVAKGWTITDGGENLGAELITVAADRDFSAGQGNWVTTGDVTWDNVAMNFNVLGVFKHSGIVIILKEGTTYRVQFDISAYTSGNLAVYLGITAGGQGITEAVETFVFYIEAGANDYLRFGGSDFVGSIDNVSLKEVL